MVTFTFEDVQYVYNSCRKILNVGPKFGTIRNFKQEKTFVVMFTFSKICAINCK